ncbi:Aste57867_18170 [Aphanomyces stellatus]|uniref:Aste57867_18170 protein n=1 Tax=Aphanomyces stellatus TaxID=120398 RepID=A0A485LB36_9STRA|nr:hypothetical protein As57867_018108 [Aphanomyces stellatus]VFT94908.1 Aste57867_18170 [Aphanomyces stellatus]
MAGKSSQQPPAGKPPPPPSGPPPPTGSPKARKRKKGGVHPLKKGRLEWGRHMKTKKRDFAATMIQRKFRAYRHHMDHRDERVRVRETMQRIKKHRIFFDREYWEGVNLRDLKRAELEDLAFRLELPVTKGKKEGMIRTIQHWVDLRMHVQNVAIEAAMRATEKKLQAQGCVYVLAAAPKAEPRIIRPLSGRNITVVAAGHESEAMYAIDTGKGAVWLCKTSGLSSQVGFCSTLANQDVFDLPYQSTWLANPNPMQTLRIGHIESIRVAHSHALALAKAGEVYSWGSNPHGQLGAENAAKHHQTPVVVGGIESFVSVSIGVGAQHSIAVCDRVKGRDGVVFAWGANSHAQLGVDLDDGATAAFYPIEVTSLHGIVVRKVSCGTLHSVVVTEQGDVYSWGCNDGGRLAHPMCAADDNIVSRPRQVKGFAPPYEKAIDVVCGPWHTTAIMVERPSQTAGVVFAWGNGTCGQLGQGNLLHATSPQMVMLPPMKRAEEPRELVTALACGMSHTAVLTERGNLYTWGSKQMFSPLPHKLPSLKGSRGRIASIACGSSFTAFCILSTDETLYEAQHRHLLWHTRTTEVPKLDLSLCPPIPLWSTSQHACLPRLQPMAEQRAEEAKKKQADTALDSIDLHDYLHPRCRLCWRCPGFVSNLNQLTMCQLCKHKREHHGKRLGPMGEYEAVRKLQSKYRQRQGTKYLHHLFLERMQRVFSIRHDTFFYYNIHNHEKRWTRPRLLPLDLDCPIRDPDDEVVRPPYTPDDAACVIQGLYRAMKARKFLRMILNSRYETLVDKASGKPYYRDRRTNAVRWTRPFEKLLAHADHHHHSRHRREPMTRDEAVAIVQRCTRGAIARKRLRKMLQKRFKALIDSSTGATYYYDASTKQVSWTKPRFFVDDASGPSPKPKRPAYTESSAASLLQRVYRGRRARRSLIELLQSRFQQAWDPKTQKFYFVNTVTHETMWDKPALLKNVVLPDVPVHHKRKKKKAYNMSDVDAAMRLQAVLRSKITRKRAQKELHRLYERVWDPETQAFFYHNLRTKEVTWTAPKLWNDAVYEKIEQERARAKAQEQAEEDSSSDGNVGANVNVPKDDQRDIEAASTHNTVTTNASTKKRRRRDYAIRDPNEAAKVIQALFRRRRGWTESIKTLLTRFQKVYDPNTQRYFYFDQEKQVSMWEAPRLLQKSKAKATTPKFKSPESAATHIQGIFRLRKARQEALQLAQANYEKVFDEAVQAYYYFNTRTGESQWTKPKCLRDSDVVHVLKLDIAGRVVEETEVAGVPTN